MGEPLRRLTPMSSCPHVLDSVRVERDGALRHFEAFAARLVPDALQHETIPLAHESPLPLLRVALRRLADPDEERRRSAVLVLNADHRGVAVERARDVG